MHLSGLNRYLTCHKSRLIRSLCPECLLNSKIYTSLLSLIRIQYPSLWICLRIRSLKTANCLRIWYRLLKQCLKELRGSWNSLMTTKTLVSQFCQMGQTYSPTLMTSLREESLKRFSIMLSTTTLLLFRSL